MVCFNLNSYSSIEIIGVRGSSMLDRVIRVGNIIVCLVLVNCQVIFILFVDGKIVSDE